MRGGSAVTSLKAALCTFPQKETQLTVYSTSPSCSPVLPFFVFPTDTKASSCILTLTLRIYANFVPLPLVYSMNEDITALKSTYGWYFLTSIPFTLLVMLAGWMIGTESWMPWRDNEHVGIFGGKDVTKKKEQKKKEKNTEND
jgi:hypothetical protein